MPAWYHDAFSTTYIFNFPDSQPEVKTVVCVLSTADGPLIVLKQTCRYCESRGPSSEALGMQPEWCLETIGESIALCSCVSRLCVYCSMAPNTGKDPLIPPYLWSLISVAAFGHPTKRNLPLQECFCQELQETGRLGVQYEILICNLCFSIYLKTAPKSQSILLWLDLILST